MPMLAPTQVGVPMLDAINARNLDAWFAALAPDYQADFPGITAHDRETARGFNQLFIDAFPDLRFSVEQEWSVGETSICIFVAEGTHEATLVLPTQAVPPTGRHGHVRGVLVSTLRDGRITKEQTFWDRLDLMMQLGLIPAT
jgi:ketosteroid isomerase-like protein